MNRQHSRQLSESSVVLSGTAKTPENQAQKTLERLGQELNWLGEFHGVWTSACQELLALTTGAVTPAVIEARQHLAEVLEVKKKKMDGIWAEYDQLEKLLKTYRETETF